MVSAAPPVSSPAQKSCEGRHGVQAVEWVVEFTATVIILASPRIIFPLSRHSFILSRHECSSSCGNAGSENCKQRLPLQQGACTATRLYRRLDRWPHLSVPLCVSLGSQREPAAVCVQLVNLLLQSGGACGERRTVFRGGIVQHSQPGVASSGRVASPFAPCGPRAGACAAAVGHREGVVRKCAARTRRLTLALGRCRVARQAGRRGTDCSHAAQPAARKHHQPPYHGTPRLHRTGFTGHDRSARGVQTAEEVDSAGR